MPNLPAAKKSMRKDRKRHEKNRAIESGLKTLIKKLNDLISQKKQPEAAAILREVISALDKAAKTGIIKKNTASRKKSRLSKKVTHLGA